MSASAARARRAGRAGPVWLLALAAWLAVPAAAGAATAIGDLSASPDVSISVFPEDFDDEDVVGSDAADLNMPYLGALPSSVSVTAYHVDVSTGDALFSVDVPVTLSSTLFLPGDVIRWDGLTHTPEFDSTARGIGLDASVDAVSAVGGSLLLSFDVAVTLEGVVVEPADVVEWTIGPPPAAELLFDASAEGVPAGLNLDAAHYVDGNNLLLASFDTSGSVGGAGFDDEDLVEADLNGVTWEIVLQLGDLDTDWLAADLEALHAIDAAVDNCKGTWNPDQADEDSDNLGDACDANLGNPDADGDGLLDGDEVNVYGTDPEDADSDDDGLNDYDEVTTHSTDPNDVDSDDDGWSDAIEVALGSDPNAGGSVPSILDGAPFAIQSQILASGTTVSSAAVGDLDGDGDLDVVYATTGGLIYWREKTGPSTWTQHDLDPDLFGGPLSVAVGDVDGDGDLDVAASDPSAFGAPGVFLYENILPAAGPWPQFTVEAFSLAPGPVTLGDIDGDGDVDVHVSNIFLGDTWFDNGSWTPTTTGLLSTGRAVLVDLDRDGDLDVASDNGWSENTLGDGSSWSVGINFTWTGVDVVDVDRDGDPDLIGATITGEVGWLENVNDAASFVAHIAAVPLNSASGPVTASDLDGDGDPDLVLGTTGGTLDWYENTTGDGSLWAPRSEPTGSGNPVAVAAADLDGDGDTDLLAANNGIDWWKNETIHRSAIFPAEDVLTSAALGAYVVTTGDVDGDGDLDALAASWADDTVAWYENTDGAGSFGAAQTITNSANAVRSAVLADVDGDGDLDALSASSGDDTVAWYENTDGAGSFGAAQVLSSAASGARAVFAADVDGDGDLDAIAGAGTSNTVAWYENDGTPGGLGDWTARNIHTGAGGVYAVFAADVDGDGDVDVISADQNYDRVSWYENSGASPPVWTQRTVTTATDAPQSVHAADLDADGDLDVLSASAYDDTIAWYESDGASPPVWTRRVISTGAVGAKSVRAADVDADGDLDVLSASYNDGTIAWYENDGAATPTFTAADPVTTARFLANWVHTADLDRDGDLDVLSASVGDNTIAWYANRGGQFALPTTSVQMGGALQGTAVALMQIEPAHRGRSGDSDLFVATLELLFEETQGDPLSNTEAGNLIDELRIYEDNGTTPDVFDASDTLIWTSGAWSPALTAGVESLDVSVSPDFHLTHGAAQDGWWVVVLLSANAASQSPNLFRVTHLTESTSSGQDAVGLVSVELEYAANATADGIALDPALDSDNDGLSNADEINVHGTDPLDSDTDDDGRSDYDEVNTPPLTDPLDPDSDDDGWLDGFEVLVGSDPNLEDTDGEGICDGPIQTGTCTQAGPDLCPLIPSLDQSNSDSLPAGDVCQCGDVTGDGPVTALDLQVAREELVGQAVLSGPFDANRCDVNASGDCDVGDLYVLERFLNGDPVTVEMSCADFTTP